MGFLSNLFTPQNQFQYQNAGVNQSNLNGNLQQQVGQQQQNYGQQQQLIQALQNQMTGGGPNLGQTQLQAATDRANSQAAGLIGSSRGLDPALAARQILGQQAQNTQAAANQSAQLQQQQQLAAQGQLGTQLANTGQQTLGALGTIGQIQQGQNALNVQQALGGQNLNLQAQLANQKAQGQGVGGVLGGVGALGASALGLAEGAYIHDMTNGGHVPGQAIHEGDNPENDTVHAMLSPGEVVLPRSVVKDADPKEIQKFVEALKGVKSKEKGYGKVLRAKQKLKRYEN